MLIDSGADATMLPRAPDTSLGLEGPGEQYQLVGFDGTVSESEAVLASLAFLRSEREFRGPYLLTEAEVEAFVRIMGEAGIRVARGSWPTA